VNSGRQGELSISIRRAKKFQKSKVQSATLFFSIWILGAAAALQEQSKCSYSRTARLIKFWYPSTFYVFISESFRCTCSCAGAHTQAAMRLFKVKNALLVALVTLQHVAAVDKSKFRTCDTSGFCKRQRCSAATACVRCLLCNQHFRC
jgi:hypothetical protein